MTTSAKKDFKQLAKRLKRDGWEIEYSRGQHIKLTGPNGELVFHSASPGDQNALHSLRREIRHAQAKPKP